MSARTDPAVAEALMVKAGFQPSTPYQSALKPWPGVCLRCGRPGSPRYNSIQQGKPACGFCAGSRIDPDLARGLMLARDFMPIGEYPGGESPWPGFCLKCENDSAPTFHNVKQGHKPCRRCATAEAPKRQPGPLNPCTVPGCERPVAGHGYCKSHYSNWRRQGNPLGLGDVTRLRKTEEVAHQAMLEAGFSPSVPYPSSKMPWPGVCLRCARPGAPTLASVLRGQGACGYCAGNRVEASIAVGKMIAAGFQPSVPYPGRASDPWPGVCLRCGQPGNALYDSVRGGRGACQYCAKVRVDRAIAEGKLLAAGARPLVPYPGTSKVPWLAECITCGATVAPVYNSIASGHSACNDCQPGGGFSRAKPGVLYVVANDEWVKVGISNAKHRRLRQHHTAGLTELLYVTEYGTGHDAHAHERLWKEYIAGLPASLRATRKDFRNGYSETARRTPEVMEFIAQLIDL